MHHLTEYFFVGLTGFFYVIGEYKISFWLCIYRILNHAGAAVRAAIDPDWYYRKRAEANLPTDLFGSPIKSLTLTKLVLIAVFSVAAWRAGTKAGYF